MKNKLRLIDINIVSAYMGRFMTLFVMAAVLAVTISALFSKGGVRDHLTLTIQVPSGRSADDALDFYEPLRYLLAKETGRTVRVQAPAPPAARPTSDNWCGECELYVLPMEDFVASREEQRLTALYSISPTEHRRDTAVLIKRHGETIPAVLTQDDVVFTSPKSVNGCWVQLLLLESEGFAAPETIASLRFAPVVGGATWVVYAVLFGEYAVGACRQSDLAALVSTGSLRGDEITVVRTSPAVPEVVLACRSEDAGYYRGLLETISAKLADPNPPGTDRDAIELMKSRGMRSLLRVSQDELGRATALFDRMRGRI